MGVGVRGKCHWDGAGVILKGAGLGEIAIPICGLCGVFVMAVMVMRAAGQPARVAELGGPDEADRPKAMPQRMGCGPADRLCPHCGACLPDVGDAFCPECREPLS